MPGRNVTVIAGISGMGKGAFASRYMCNADLACRFIFDHEISEFDPDKGDYQYRLQLPATNDTQSISAAIPTGWVCFDPHKLFPGAIEEAFDVFCELAIAKSMEIPGPKVLVVSEVWNFCTPHSIPHLLKTIVQSGRKFNGGLHLIVDLQEPNRLNSAILNGVSEFVCFKLQSKPALGVATENGFNPDEVAGLAPFQFVARNTDSGGELRGTIEL